MDNRPLQRNERQSISTSLSDGVLDLDLWRQNLNATLRLSQLSIIFNFQIIFSFQTIPILT
jgi:hypothetical protein